MSGWASFQEGEATVIAHISEDGSAVDTLTIHAPRITSDTLRLIRPSRYLASSRSPGDPRKPLGRPSSPASLDQFYQRVANAYLSASCATSRPAVVLAEENDTPVGTVHRWVREARRRGHLPPGRRGTAA